MIKKFMQNKEGFMNTFVRGLYLFLMGGMILVFMSCEATEEKEPAEGDNVTDPGENPVIVTPVSEKDTADQMRYLLQDLGQKQGVRSGQFLDLSTIKNLNFDPIAPIRCGSFMENAEFQTVMEELGGIKWGLDVRYFRNEKLPYFYNKKPELPYDHYGEVMEDGRAMAGTNSKASNEAVAMDSAAPEMKSAGSAPPSIKRADLIARYENFIIFLSKKYGLFFVKVSDDKAVDPEISCSVLVPGDPLNFYVKDGKLILLTNPGGESNHAAVIRFKLAELSLEYESSYVLKDRYIHDSRLFNGTLAILNKYVKPIETEASTSSSGSSDGIAVKKMSSSSMAYYPQDTISRYHFSVLETLDEKVNFVFEDSFQDNITYPEWGKEWSADDIGTIASHHASFNSFISASDRYLVISKYNSDEVVKKIVTTEGTRYTCKKREKREDSYETCYPIWEEVVNNDYDSTIDCTTSSDVSGCFAENAHKLVKSIWRKTGEKCEEVTYTYTTCVAYEDVYYKHSYPHFKRKESTDLIIYKYGEDGFVRLTDPKAETSLNLAGSVKEHKSFNFKDGYFYAVSSTNPDWDSGEKRQTSVHSFKIVEDGFLKTGSVEDLGVTETLRSVLFSGDTLFLVTFKQIDPLYAIDLSIPHKPVLKAELKVPGYSSQLIATEGLLVGMGMIDPKGGERWQSHSKVSLYDVSSLSKMDEINTLILGEEYGQANNDVDRGNNDDDQVYHWNATDNRLFFAYSGILPYDRERKFKEHENMTCHYNYNPNYHLTITHMSPDGVSLESDVKVPERIIRSLSYGEDRAMSFGDTAVIALEKEGENWDKKVLRQYWINDGLYEDPSLGDLMVAKQIKGAYYSPTAIRFVLGTKEDIAKGENLKILSLDEEIVECLGDPTSIRFFDNNLLVTYKQSDWLVSGKDEKRVEYKKQYGWKIDAEGFTAMSKEEMDALDGDMYLICYFKKEQKFADDAGLKEIVTSMEDQNVTCEKRSELPWEPEIFCFLDDHCVDNSMVSDIMY